MVKKIIKIAYIVLALAFIYAPIILLTVYSFNLSPSIGIWSKKWGFGLYKQLFTDKSIMQTVLNTVVLALLASVCSTILGTIGAIGTFYSKRKVKGALNALTQIPVINAEIVTAISIALVCSMFAFGRTYASLLIGHIVLCFPFVYLSVIPKLKQLDGNLYEAALDLESVVQGHTSRDTSRYIQRLYARRYLISRRLYNHNVYPSADVRYDFDLRFRRLRERRKRLFGTCFKSVVYSDIRSYDFDTRNSERICFKEE